MDQFDLWQKQFGAPDPRGQRPARPQRKRGKHGFGFLVLLCLAVGAVLQLGLTPWVLHIGGRFTPTMTWDGYGQLNASNGGRYLLFTHLGGGRLYYRGSGRPCSRTGGGCDDLFGTATLCSRNGSLETFALRGQVRGFLHTDGAPTNIQLTRAAPTPLPSGWVVAFHGRWDGPELSLDSPDNSFTQVFTPGGTIRHVTSSADAGTAHVALHYGSFQDFQLACSALHAAEGHRASR